MPLLTRIFIKTAMICLALALVLGILLASGETNSLFPVYIHLLVFGWLTYALLNIGLLLRAIAEPIQSARPNPLGGWMLLLAASLQFLSGVLFVVNSWGRVKEK